MKHPRTRHVIRSITVFNLVHITINSHGGLISLFLANERVQDLSTLSRIKLAAPQNQILPFYVHKSVTISNASSRPS